ncbi:hypothetical protein J4232_01215 [Candidatus Woesearchaeota archaeon]|nr:hypothetical protein [Candidatus Woesearchaeota archaeon]
MTQYKQIYSSAEFIYLKEDYTSATILYFKAIFVSLDSMILSRIGRTPKDHTERFTILKKEFPEYYKRLDILFQIYRDTYTKKIDKETCEEIRNEARYFVEQAQKSS